MNENHKQSSLLPSDELEKLTEERSTSREALQAPVGSRGKKRYRPYDQNQMLLLAPSLNDWLPENHLARFISDVVEHIDASAITEVYEQELRGYPPYHPLMLLKVLIYAYCTGVYSSRKIAAACEDVVAFRFLSGDQMPDFRTISDFRKRHLGVFKELFLQTVHIAQNTGMVKLGHVALDGSKVKANASKHKAMTYGRMKQEEQRLRQEISELLQRAQRTDRLEDAKYGTARGDELPEELARRESRLAKIRESMTAMEAEAKARAEAEEKKQKKKRSKKEAQPEDGKKKRRGRPPKKEKPAPDVPEDKAQRNFTDPESRIMRTKDGFDQAYNVQAVVDDACQIIVATEVTDHANDAGVLREMVDTVAENTGRTPKRLSCDAGYYADDDVEWLKNEKNVDPYIATGRQAHNEIPDSPRGRIPESYTPKQRMARKLRTKAGRLIYARRKVIVEPVFGQIKGCRGFNRFSLRGKAKVQGEWSLVAACHNLLKLFKYGNIQWTTA